MQAKAIDKADETHDSPVRSRSSADRSTPTGPSPTFGVASIQQGAGNLAVQRMFQAGSIQAKLSISEPGGPDEQEADQVADRVMRMPVSMEREPALPLSPSQSQPIHVQRSCAACALGEPCSKCADEQIQRKAAHSSSPEVSADVDSQIAPIHGGGEPMPSSVRAFFEPRFNQDFSHVRVHKDRTAAESASAIQARAFTSGHDIVFGEGQYAPQTSEGKRLLAHELTHVVQQGGGTAISRNPSIEHARKRIMPARSGRIQRDWFDDAKAVASSAYTATASAVGGAVDAVTSAVGAGAKEIASEAQGAATTVSGVGQAIGSSVSNVGKAASADPEKIRADLIARVNGMRQMVLNTNPDTTTADPSKIAALNNNISSLNSLLPPTVASIPLVFPGLAPAAGTGLGEILTGIGAALGGLAAGEILLIVVLLLAILALIFAIAKSPGDVKPGENEEDKKKRRQKEKEAEDENKRREREKEEEEERKKDQENPCRKPFRWNPITSVKKAVASGGTVGALELCIGAPTPPSGLQFDGHHVWPKFAGGPEIQPLMGIFSFVHLSVMHPTLLNPLLTATFGITTRTTDPKNIAFTTRLRREPALRAQVAAVLTGFYVSLNTQTSPPIPALAFGPAIASSLAALSL